MKLAPSRPPAKRAPLMRHRKAPKARPSYLRLVCDSEAAQTASITVTFPLVPQRLIGEHPDVIRGWQDGLRASLRRLQEDAQ